ncbi:hypothetical protein ACRALDRAFT_1063328, partial [Sodiomyces alcalophilus JCM 7366]|uniref:uncharacterized protein n=1 Tax=Sodiomyces alcalophilus JCM 7366 TaxID=591952 RepID=UPI0039B636E4
MQPLNQLKRRFRNRSSLQRTTYFPLHNLHAPIILIQPVSTQTHSSPCHLGFSWIHRLYCPVPL